MEEEINYEIMRYDLDENGYILNVYFGCASGTCTGYTGTIPEGYESLEDWSANENIRAYKIVDGNLTFDATRNAQLEKQYAKEEEDNRLVCYKEIKNITSIYKQDLYDMYQTSTSKEAKMLELTDANRFEAIKVKLKSGGKLQLPEEYQQVEYIESTGTQYIDTGVIVDSNLVIETRQAFLFNSDLHGSTSYFSIGSADASRNRIEIGYQPSTNKFWANCGTVTDRPVNFPTDENIHVFKWKGDEYFSIDGTELNTSNPSYTPFTGTTNFYLFKDNNRMSNWCPVRQDYCKIWNGETLIRYLIPCYRKSDNVIGLYDAISNVFYTNAGTGEFLKGNDISLPIKDKVTIKSTNANMLPNEATSKEESGISFVENEDKSLTLNGTATADIEFVIAGSSENTKPILHFIKNEDYYLSSGNHTVTMYDYDGTERVQIFSGTENIKFTDEDKNCTQVVLSIPSGTVIDNETIYLMLNPGTEAEQYVLHDSNEVTIDLEDYAFVPGDRIDIEDGEVTLYKELYPSSTLYPSNTLYPRGTSYNLESIDIMPVTYKDKTIVYAFENVTISMEYPNTSQNIEYENTSSKNGGFIIDDEGNMECNNAKVNGTVNSNNGVIGGWTINNEGFTNGDVFIRSNGYSSIYTFADMVILRNYLLGNIELDDNEKPHYDLNGDGIINSADLLKLVQMILGTDILGE